MSPALSQSVISPPSNHISWLFPECYGGFPSAHRRPNYHQFCRSAFCTQWQEKCFPCLSSPFLSSPFAISLSDPLSSAPSQSVSFSYPLQHTHIHTRTSVSVRNERGENYRTVCIFPELLKSALMLMADHVHQSAWTFLTHTYTQRHANLHVNSSKRHLVARRLVLSIRVCVLGCV